MYVNISNNNVYNEITSKTSMSVDSIIHSCGVIDINAVMILRWVENTFRNCARSRTTRRREWKRKLYVRERIHETRRSWHVSWIEIGCECTVCLAIGIPYERQNRRRKCPEKNLYQFFFSIHHYDERRSGQPEAHPMYSERYEIRAGQASPAPVNRSRTSNRLTDPLLAN